MIVDLPPRPLTAMMVVDETEEADKATCSDSEPSISGDSASLGGLSARMRLSALMSDTRDLMSGMSVMSNDNQIVAKEEGLLVSTSSSLLTSATGSESSDDKNNNGDQTMEQVQTKSDEIQRCLAGSDSTELDVVDLWHLRTLSLSPGGLLNATLRKRCWPKLLGLDEAILLNTSNNTCTMVNSLSGGFSGSIRSLAVSTLAIQSALTKYEMPWDVESMIKSQRRAREAERTQSLLLRCAGNDNSSDAASVASSSISSIAAPGTFYKQGKKEMTKQELSIITNILTAVLRQTTSGLDAKIDPAIIRQLANLAALLLINLESPSLTTLMMQSLAKEQHLHLADDEIEKTRSTPNIDDVFWTLVSCQDEKIGSMLRNNMLAADTKDDDESSFVAGWITSWFASALPTGIDSSVSVDTGTDSIASIELEVASRFIDVFLCSHPYMPIYVAVALVLHPVNRSQIEVARTPSSLANLPSAMMASVLGITDEIFFDGNRNDGVGNTDNIAEDRRAELMTAVEEIIADGIDLM